MDADSGTDARHVTRTLARAQGLDIEHDLAGIQAALAGHQRDAARLRDAVALSDEPVTVFHPLRTSAGADATR